MSLGPSPNVDSFFENHPDLVLSDRDLHEFQRSVVVQTADTGTILVPRGAECRYLPFVLKGSVKVHRTAENGREIVLYHIREGESCILSALGIANNTHFPAVAEIESTSDVLLIPGAILGNIVDRYASWRRYIFAIYNERLGDVLELVDEMLFRKIDVRLARYLLHAADADGNISNMTHQDLALELGSSREVISRVLKSLEGKGYLSYGRGRIDILNKTDLKKMAEL